MCTAQYSACWRDLRGETHILYSIWKTRPGPTTGLWKQINLQLKRLKRSTCLELCFNYLFQHWFYNSAKVHKRNAFYAAQIFFFFSNTVFTNFCGLVFSFPDIFEMCEVRSASPVPWVSHGYLWVTIQRRCAKFGTFMPSDLIWQSWEKVVVTKQCWFVQMWTVLREAFCARTSLISQLRVAVDSEVRPQCPCTAIRPFRRTRYTLWTCGYTVSATLLCAHMSTPMCTRPQKLSACARNFRTWSTSAWTDNSNGHHPQVTLAKPWKSYWFCLLVENCKPGHYLSHTVCPEELSNHLSEHLSSRYHEGIPNKAKEERIKNNKKRKHVI